MNIYDTHRRYVVPTIIVVFCIALLYVGIGIVSADNQTEINQSHANVTIINVTAPENATEILTTLVNSIPASTETITDGYRINQGDCVYPGETIDFAGMGWYTGRIVYFGKYFDNYGTSTNDSAIAFYEVKSQNLTHFFLEPGFFSQHEGWWYPDYSMISYEDSNGYDRLFYVNDTCPSEFITIDHRVISQKLPNTIAENQSEKNFAYIANVTKMPVKSENDGAIILSKNVTTTLDAPNGTHYWFFGIDSSSKFYDIDTTPNNVITWNADDTYNLPTGRYDTIFVNPGRNGIIEEEYNKKDDAIESPFRYTQDTSLHGIQSNVAEDFLKSKISTSRDDNYTSWKVDVQDPSIQITKMNQNPLDDNHSLIVLAGYTNMNQGDNLHIEFDALNPNNNVVHDWNAIVMNNGGQGAYRIWNTSFIIDFTQIAPGQHYFNVTSNEGARASVPVYRRVELKAHYVPPEELGFFDNSPFIPTPTPERIEVPVPGPTQIVTVIVTQTPDYNTLATHIIDTSLPYVIAALICLIVVIYGVRTICKAITKERRNNP